MIEIENLAKSFGKTKGNYMDLWDLMEQARPQL